MSETHIVFKAPDSIIDACLICRMPIHPGEMILIDQDGEFLHESCIQDLISYPDCEADL